MRGGGWGARNAIKASRISRIGGHFLGGGFRYLAVVSRKPQFIAFLSSRPKFPIFGGPAKIDSGI